MASKKVSSRTIRILVSCLLIFGALFLPSLTVNVSSQTQTATTHTETVLNTTATIPAISCHYILWTLVVAPGTSELTGTIGPTSYSVDFYIMNTQQYVAFENANCGTGPYTALVSEINLNSASSYALDWKNPAPGSYYFIFDNEYGLPSSPITVPLTLEGVFTQYAGTATISTTITVTTYQSTSTQTVTQSTG